MFTDGRLEAMRGILLNLSENPADQTDDFLMEVSNLAQDIRGQAEVERLYRAMVFEGDL